MAFQKENPSEVMPEYYLIQALSFKDLVHDGLDEWIYLFKNNQVEESFTAKGIDKAKEKLSVAKLTKKKRREYEQYLKSLHSDASWNEMQRIKAEREAKLIREAEEKMRERTRAEEQKKSKVLVKKARLEEQEKAQLLLKEAEEKRVADFGKCYKAFSPPQQINT